MTINKKNMASKDFLNTFCAEKNITLTPLRKEILTILLSKNKPLRAYDILKELKKKRDNAEPPTVYRVLDFLIDSNIVHRIESQNAYVCCVQLTSDTASHKAILLLCNTCKKSYEFACNEISSAIKNFSKENSVEIDDALIEIRGTCKKCL